MKLTLALIASALAIFGNVPYLREIWKGRVKPHPYTWLVGSIVSCTVFFGMLTKGAGIGALPVAISEGFTILIFLFSLKYGFKKITPTDKLFLVLALAGLVPWYLTKDPTISIICAVVIDLLSLVPTLRKAWEYPATEHSVLYGSNVLRHILMLLSLQTYNLATTLHSVAMILANTVLVGVISRKRS